MRFLRGLPIQRKLTVVLALNAAIALVLGAVGFSAYEVAHAREDAQRELRTAAEMIGANSGAALIFSDAVSAEETLQALAADSRIVAARLYTADGRVFADYRAGGGPELPARAPLNESAYERDGCIYFYREIAVDGDPVGGILLEADLGEVRSRLIVFGVLLLIGVLVVTAVSVAVSSRLQALVSRPILDLARIARKVRDDDDYSLRAEAADRDEIGELVESFNAMLEKVDNRDRFLEEQVRQRTEQLQREKERAEEAARLKSEFLANMSHEIRTPMNVILGMTELTLDAELPSRERKHLEMAHRSAETLLTIINDILDFSKVEAGKLELEPVEFDLGETLAEVGQSFSMRANERGLRLIVSIPPQLPRRVVGDPIRLRQVLINLTANAVKFTSQGQVEIGARVLDASADAAMIELRVKDTGIGIPEEKQKLIFDAFAQADGSTSRRFGGTGLGLAICNRLVSLMGGKITVRSELNAGSEFRCTIPFPVVSVSEEPPNDLDGKRAMIIDPAKDGRRRIADTLGSWGLHSACADSVETARAIMRWSERVERPFAVLIVDAAALESNDHPGVALPPLPVVVVGEPARREALQRLKGAPVEVVLQPLSRSDLLTALSRVLRSEASAPAVQATPPASETVNEAPAGGLDILLAEDIRENQVLAVELLERAGHRVRLASNGREALEQWRRRRPSLILMDIQMPGMGGVEATKEIRKRESVEGGYTPIIALTAHAIKGDRERYLAAGMDDYLSKPIRRKEFHRVLERVTHDFPPAVTAFPANDDKTPFYSSRKTDAG